jgi:hypothetical protein
MMRSVGIPSQLVLGYRGCESQGDGHYLVRQEDAHAWAEVLLPRIVRGEREWYWSAFDPTPSSSSTGAEEAGGIIESGAIQGKRFFTEFVIGLNPESQRRLADAIAEFLDNYWPAGVASVLAAVGLCSLIPGWRRKRVNNHSRTPENILWFTKLIDALHRAGCGMIPGETPHEFAVRAGAWLNAHSDLASDANVPLEAARFVYALRYAETSVKADQLASLCASIDELCRRLPRRAVKQLS